MHRSRNSSERIILLSDQEDLDVNYTPEHADVEEEEDEDDVKTASVRFVPADSNVGRSITHVRFVTALISVHQLYQIMNECQELNPDPEEEISDEGDDEEPLGHVEEVDLGLSAGPEDWEEDAEMDSSAQWFTSETPDGEVILSPEGRANLERIMGDFEKPPPAPGQFR